MAAATAAAGAENSGTIDVILTLLPGASGLPISLRYTTTDGTATTADTDYTGVAGGTHTIAAGDTTSTISLAVTGDATYEADETFTVEIGNATTTNGAVTATATTTTVTIENDEVPTAAADPNYTSTEGILRTIPTSTGVLVNDDGAGLAVTRTANLVTDVATGTLALAADGSFTYLPPGDFPHTSSTATTTFVYSFFDGRFTSTNATATIVVTNVNDAPIAVSDFYAVLPGQTSTQNVAAGVLANDFDNDGDNLTAVLVGALTSTPSDLTAGSLTFNADGSFVYDPKTFVGTATFDYRAQDPSNEFSATTTVTLSQGPTWLMTVDPSTVDEDASTKDVLLTLINPDTTTVSTAVLATENGTATAGSDYTAVSQTVTLGGAGATSTTITITVLNDAGDPIREGIEFFTVRLATSSANSVISGDAGNGKTATVNIDDQQDIPYFTILAGNTVQEGLTSSPSTLTNTTGTIWVTSVGKTFITSTVDWSTVQTTTNTSTWPYVGIPGADYTAVVAETLTFGPNTASASTAMQAYVSILDDNIDEFAEVLLVMLDSGSGWEFGTGLPTTITTTDSQLLTINDNDGAPSLSITNKKVVESVGATAISVTLTGRSSGGVSVGVSITENLGTAMAGSDYETGTPQLSWSQFDVTDTKTIIVTTTDDVVEEDAETVTLLLINETTTEGPAGVAVSDGSAILTITDDEAAAKVVGIVSDGEGMRGDQFFVVVAAADSLQHSNIISATLQAVSGFTGGPLLAIASVDDIVRGQHNLNFVRSKTSTHVALLSISSTEPLGKIDFAFDLNYTAGSDPTVTTTAGTAISINVVGSRTNRNFFLSPGINFVGLGLVPAISSTATQLEQAVPNANHAFADAVAAANFERGVELKDVVEKIFVFDCVTTKPTCDGVWNLFHTTDALSGASSTDPNAGALTYLKPFQGMIIKTRITSTPAGGSGISVFDKVNVAGFGPTGVPVKMNIVGPFIDVTTNVPLAPPEHTLRFGWNLIAPHTQEAAPFNIVFNDVVVPDVLASRAISFIREIRSANFGGNIIGDIVEEFAIATWNEIIRPEFAYWTRINPHPASSVTPIIGPSGPDGGGEEK